MTNRIKKLNFIFSLFMLSMVPAFSEPFRVAKLHLVNLLQDANFEEEIQLGLNDALAIYLPENRDFIAGIEIKMNIPEQTALWNDCCACYVYENINPIPSKDQIDFSGNKVFFEMLPGRLSWILQIPFSKENDLKTNQYTTKLETLPDISENFIFIRLQQIMKGIPDSVMNSKISIAVRPILYDKGLLKIKLSEDNSLQEDSEEYSSEKTDSVCTIFIDDETVDNDSEGYFLATGIHNISVISENYRTEFRSVRIDQAKTTDLNIILKSIEPTIIVTAPEGTAVKIDDEELSVFGKELLISEGEHKIKFAIGDYEIIRNISIIKGKTYKVNLAVDLQINEE